MRFEIVISFPGQEIKQTLDVEPTETRSAESLVESKVRRLAKEYAHFRPKVSWREIIHNPT